MKKLFSTILVLGLLLSGNAYAGCKEDIKWNWFINESKTAGVFDFRNAGSKSIKLTNVTVYDSEDEKIQRRELSIYLASGQKERVIVYSKNIRYGTGGAFQCIYDKPYGKSTTKNKKKSGFQWWYLLFIPGALVLFGAISEHNNPSKEQSKPKKKKNTETHLGIKKGSTEGKTIGIIIMVVFWGIVIFAILKSNNF